MPVSKYPLKSGSNLLLIFSKYFNSTNSSKIKKPSLLKQRWETIRTRLIRMGVIRPFAGQQDGLGHEESQIVRAVVKPYRAHVESVAPSWWLRAMAVKNHNDY